MREYFQRFFKALLNQQKKTEKAIIKMNIYTRMYIIVSYNLILLSLKNVYKNKNNGWKGRKHNTF